MLDDGADAVAADGLVVARRGALVAAGLVQHRVQRLPESLEPARVAAVVCAVPKVDHAGGQGRRAVGRQQVAVQFGRARSALGDQLARDAEGEDLAMHGVGLGAGGVGEGDVARPKRAAAAIGVDLVSAAERERDGEVVEGAAANPFGVALVPDVVQAPAKHHQGLEAPHSDGGAKRRPQHQDIGAAGIQVTVGVDAVGRLKAVGVEAQLFADQLGGLVTRPFRGRSSRQGMRFQHSAPTKKGCRC